MSGDRVVGKRPVESPGKETGVTIRSGTQLIKQQEKSVMYLVLTQNPGFSNQLSLESVDLKETLQSFVDSSGAHTSTGFIVRLHFSKASTK